MIIINGLNFRGGIITHLHYYQEFGKGIDYAIQIIKGSRYERLIKLFKEKGAKKEDISNLLMGNADICKMYNIDILGELKPILDDLDIKTEVRKILWAMHKSCNEDAPNYDDWGFEYDFEYAFKQVNKEIDKTLTARSKKQRRQIANGSKAPAIIQTIALGKKLGFTFDELQTMTTQTFINIVEEICAPKKDPVYLATQEDINKWAK